MPHRTASIELFPALDRGHLRLTGKLCDLFLNPSLAAVDRIMAAWQMRMVEVDSSDLRIDDRGLSHLCAYLDASTVAWAILPGPLWDKGAANSTFRNHPNTHFIQDPLAVFPEDSAPMVTFNIFAFSQEQMRSLGFVPSETKPVHLLVGEIANEAYIKAIMDRAESLKS